VTVYKSMKRFEDRVGSMVPKTECVGVGFCGCVSAMICIR
jgi:hypothetical protein